MDELIRKQDAIDAMLGDKVQITNVIRAIGNERDFEVLNCTCDRHAEIIKALPPVQPERIKGHWIEITSRNHTYKCSVCGRLLVNITDGKNNVAKNYPYCHCGADMRGKTE